METNKTMVSSHITNTEKSTTIDDLSDLLNIENVNGDETYTQNGNSIVWNANGDDIYYQGDTQKELPIACTVTYTLDGQEISASDLAGKSGKVTIKIAYQNKDAHVVDIDGKSETLYTPFVIVAGTTIDNDNNKNITISNGKTMDNGTNTVVTGIALPGLQESLDISKDEIDIPDTIEISMDATDFELNNIVSFVSPKIIDKKDVNLFDDLDEVFDKVSELQSASKQLVSGADKLNEGAQTLNSSVDTLNNGANELSSGTSQVSDGASQVATNMANITKGATSLVNGQKSIVAGLATIKSKLSSEAEIDKNKQDLTLLSDQDEATINKLKTGNAQITVGLTQYNDNLGTFKMSDITEKNINSEIKTVENNITGVNSLMTTELNKTTPDITTVKGYNTNLQGLQSANIALNKMLNLVQTKANNENLIKLLEADKNAVDAEIASLDSMKELSAGINNLYSGSNKLQTGAKQLQSGSEQLQTGANTLSSASKQVATGASTLANGTSKLKDGTNELATGASTLAEGITTFDEDGIEKIANYINGDVKKMTNRLEKLSDLADEYDKFTMVNDGNESSVKFVMVIDAIKKDNEEDSDKQMILNSDNNDGNSQNEEDSPNN